MSCGCDRAPTALFGEDPVPAPHEVGFGTPDGVARDQRLLLLLEAWVSSLRLLPRKPISPSRPTGPSPGGSCDPASSFGRKLFMLHHASSSVPSTEKCSPDKSRFTCGRARIADRKRPAISPSSSCSRFLEKVDAPLPVVGAELHEPAKQKFEVQPLHHLPLRAEAMEQLQQQREQQLLRCDRWPSDPPIDWPQLRSDVGERLVHQPADRPQRMPYGTRCSKSILEDSLPDRSSAPRISLSCPPHPTAVHHHIARQPSSSSAAC